MMLAPALLLSLCSLLPRSDAGGERPPNVLVVMTDDQGYGELSRHGNPLLQTPHLDRLAEQSLRFTDFHVAPMCTATRGQLLSGLDALRNGAMNVSSGRSLLRPELPTLAELFRDAGHRTGIFGKWHLGDNHPYRPVDRGFEEALWFPSSYVGAVPTHWNDDYFDDTYRRDGPRGHRKVKASGYCTDVFFDQARRWIASLPAEQPFFVYLPLNAPHGPHYVPEEYREPIRAAIEARPEVVEGMKPARLRRLTSYLAMCANIDENVGRLDDFLQRSGLADDTILVFLTDNGSTMGPEYFNAGMRGKKSSLWEGGHRVPCFVRWPGGELGPPRDIDALCQVQDLLPTLAELAGIEAVPPRLDGISLADLMRGEVDHLADRMLVVNYSRMPIQANEFSPDNASIPRKEGAAVLWRHWRLLEDRALYDLRDDPHQDRDVAAEHPEVVAAMRAHLDRWWQEVEPLAREPQRVDIGHPAENPTRLSACEWWDVFVDQQRQIRAGVPRNGTWHLDVRTAGAYQISLRRWPWESGLRLDEGASIELLTDGALIEGQNLQITAGRLRIGPHDLTQDCDHDRRQISFQVELEAGPVEMQTWMLDAEGRARCGAYYVNVTRLGD